MPGSYDPGLVSLSVLIAFCASYAALELAGCTTVYRGLARAIWIGGGAVAMGIGIWSMHYVGMLAFRLPVPVLYHLPAVGLSLLAAIVSSAIALFVVSRPRLTLLHLVIGSLTMGAGIFSMHYIGMMAMRLSAHCFYNPQIVALSGLIAVVVSGAALWITFNLRRNVGHFRLLRLASAVVMGVAIAAMHYTGMAAVYFRHAPVPNLSPSDISISEIAAQAIIVVTLVILFLTVIAVMAARHVSYQTELLKNTQAEYRLFIEHNLAAVVRTSLDGAILDANQMALNILGFDKREDFIGLNIQQHYWFPEDRTRILKALKQQGVVNGIEACMKRRTGEAIWILFNMALLKNVETGSSEIISTAMDISAMKKSRDDLQFAKDAAEEANRTKDQFLAKMSHELRTPLNGIMGMTTLALGSELPAEVRAYLDDVNMSANHLLRIINDVLDYSKIEASRVTLENEAFSLQQLLDDSVRTLSAPAELKKIYLQYKVTTPLPELVWGDRGRLLQILLNLLGNAVKFTDRGGVFMSVEASPINDREVALHISVSDTGVGIPPDKLDFIFGAFIQADNSFTRRFGGTGLGLAISAQLAAAMNGKISVESTLGVGSTFHLHINLAVPPVADEGLDPVSNIPSNLIAAE